MDRLISRQAVEEIINDIRDCISVEGYWAILERLKKLPLVNPQPKTGRWIAIERRPLETPRFECSECHTQEFVETCMYKPIWNYCPNCGAKMESEKGK